MLSYFPAIYPDELLYSVLARWLRHQGAVGMTGPLTQLFGRRFASASLDLPGWIGRFAAALPAERELTANSLIDQLTLFPYYTAYVPEPLRSECRNAMCAGAVSGWHMRLGITAFRVSRVRGLRFCSECLRDMELRYGELYWKRSHQLPGVLVCPEHGCALRHGAGKLDDRGRYEYVPASRLECFTGCPLVQLTGRDGLALLRDIARRSADLLVYPGEPRDFAAWTSHYRLRMGRVGLAWSARRMKLAELLASFEEHYGDAMSCIARECEGIALTGDWLPSLVRKHRKVAHPLQHILLDAFLDSRDESTGPFGMGPWPCCNPLAPHVGSLTVASVARHRNHGHEVGVFACSCGYVYTRRFIQGTGVLEPPRVQNFGPLLDIELRRLVERGSKLRPAARALGIDPKTVARRAHELRLNVTWKDPRRRELHAKALTVAGERLARDRVHHARAQGHARKNWTDIDAQLSKGIHAEADAIRKIEPPHRVSRAELERRVSRRGWLSKRLHKLPCCSVALAERAEDAAAFHDRRVRWAVQTLADGTARLPLSRLADRVGVTAASLRECLMNYSSVTPH